MAGGVKAPADISSLQQYDEQGRLLRYGPEHFGSGVLHWLKDVWKRHVPRHTIDKVVHSEAHNPEEDVSGNDSDGDTEVATEVGDNESVNEGDPPVTRNPRALRRVSSLVAEGIAAAANRSEEDQEDNQDHVNGANEGNEHDQTDLDEDEDDQYNEDIKSSRPPADNFQSVASSGWQVKAPSTVIDASESLFVPNTPFVPPVIDQSAVVHGPAPHVFESSPFQANHSSMDSDHQSSLGHVHETPIGHFDSYSSTSRDTFDHQPIGSETPVHFAIGSTDVEMGSFVDSRRLILQQDAVFQASSFSGCQSAIPVDMNTAAAVHPEWSSYHAEASGQMENAMTVLNIPLESSSLTCQTDQSNAVADWGVLGAYTSNYSDASMWIPYISCGNSNLGWPESQIPSAHECLTPWYPVSTSSQNLPYGPGNIFDIQPSHPVDQTRYSVIVSPILAPCHDQPLPKECAPPSAPTVVAVKSGPSVGSLDKTSWQHLLTDPDLSVSLSEAENTRWEGLETDRTSVRPRILVWPQQASHPIACAGPYEPNTSLDAPKPEVVKRHVRVLDRAMLTMKEDMVRHRDWRDKPGRGCEGDLLRRLAVEREIKVRHSCEWDARGQYKRHRPRHSELQAWRTR